jgi:hypothetical protein
VASYCLSDKKRNENIREELGMFNLKNKTEQYRNKGLLHTKRMEQHRLLMET